MSYYGIHIRECAFPVLGLKREATDIRIIAMNIMAANIKELVKKGNKQCLGCLMRILWIN